MLIQGPHGIDTTDKIFVHVENSAFALSRGNAVFWDTTVNSPSTHGIRVIISLGAEALNVAGIMETPLAVAVGTSRGSVGLVQCYGHFPNASVGGTVTTAGQGLLVTSSSFGSLDCRTATGIGNVGAAFGFAFANTGASPALMDVFIRAM